MSLSHDQNFKNLILDYPLQALAFFAAAEAARLDPGVRVTPIRQELPKERLSDRFFEMDVPLRLDWPDGRRDALLFVLEEESEAGRFSIHRLAVYCAQLAEFCNTDRVVPVVIFLKHRHGMRTTLRLSGEHQTYMWLEPLVCVLDGLRSRDHLDSPNLVTRLTLPCMQHGSLEEAVDARGKALQGLLAMEPDPEKRLKYDQFIRTYAPLDERGQRLYAVRYATEEDVMSSIAEKLRAEGRQQGVQQGLHEGKQQVLARLLERRFGALDEETARRLKAASEAELDGWTDQVLEAGSLPEVFRAH